MSFLDERGSLDSGRGNHRYVVWVGDPDNFYGGGRLSGVAWSSGDLVPLYLFWRNDYHLEIVAKNVSTLANPAFDIHSMNDLRIATVTLTDTSSSALCESDETEARPSPANHVEAES
jgi:hypothetical protein